MKFKITLASLLLYSAATYSQTEFINQNFGNNGVTCIDIPGQTIKMSDIVEIDGNYYGLTNFINNNLVKLSANGSIITSFGTNGYIPLNIGPTGGSIYDKDSHILVTADNKLILVTTQDGPNDHNFMTKIDPDGNTITSFGNNGYVANWNTDHIYFMSAEIINNEIILVGAGATTTTAPEDIQRYIIVKKYDIDGHPVTSFGNNGAITISTDKYMFPNGAHYFPQSNKVAIIANYFNNIEFYSLAGMYDMSTGTTDANFGTDGYIYFPQSNGYNTYPTALYCNDNTIYISGRISAPPADILFVKKMNLNGEPDFTFGISDGTYQHAMNNITNQYASSITETQGRLTITGNINPISPDFSKIYLLRLTETGVEDADFGNNGMIVTPMNMAHIGSGYKTHIGEHHITVATLSLECSSDDQPKPSVIQFLAETALKDKQHTIQTPAFYPNPVKDYLNIAASGTIDRLEVYDLTGKLTMSCTDSNNINLSKLQSGFYVVRVFEDGTISNIKIVKE